MRVLGQVGVDRGRLNLVAGPGVRRVKVARGRSGYGFTMSGQGPCLLCGVVKGSPADNVGLRPGDYILSVNGTDVSQATHETVAQLIGTSSEPLCLVVNAGRSSRPVDSCWSEEELDLQGKEEGRSFKPAKSKQSTREPRQHGNAEANRWSVASFAASTQFIGQSSSSKQQNTQFKQRPVSEPDLSYWARQGHSKSNPALFSEEEPVKVLSDDSVLSEPVQHEDDPLPDSTILNMGMVVGYINSMALNLRSADSEEDGLQAIRGCISQIGVEQSTHSLVMLKITCHGVQLCDDRGVTLTACPAENLALCAISHEDPRFFALLSLVGKPDVGEAVHLRTICHVFFIDPELYKHKAHQSIISHFDLECTPDPDTQGCLEFPPTPGSVLQFVSVLYRDMGDFIERLRLRLDREVTDEGQPNARHSGSADSGIGNVSPVGQGGRDLLPDRWDFPVPTVPNHVAHRSPPALMGQRQNASAFRAERRCLLSEPLPGPAVPPPADAPLPGRAPGTPSGPVRRNSQRWPSISIRAPWPRPRPHHPAPEAEARMPRSKSSTLPLDDAQGPRGAGAQEEFALPPATAQQHENIRRLFSGATKHKPGETKGSRFWAVGRGRSSVRRSLGRSKRLSLARSLDDLETAAASDDERAAIKLRESGSEASLDSNGSLPSAHTHRSLSERRVASWAVCFERLLQDPVGVRYFSEFLKKEFSEENILFWQACEVFSQVPENDQKQLSQQAKEIYTSFLSSKATTPVNIDSQAQLADNVLTAPKPDMFKQQQLQIFNLMKFDSYSRFLKSSLYQECMLAEVEGRPLPDPYLVPCSPAPSKHSFTSDRSTLSTPKKETRKPKPGTSSEDIRDERSDKKNGIFSWYRNRSFGKGPKKRELTDFNYASNGRRESQGSLSSSASQELNTTCSGGKSECDLRSASVLWERDREAWARPCTVALPDGSCCPMPLRQGATVRQLLLELCQKHHINMAAVDLFLVGGEKPLVLDQDSTTLSSRDLRLERRTLFRLDLVPINRSVGLKAKPTKPVTEVLRPVVAKYGLRLNDLVARISGEAEALDLGLPISNLDGLRVVLERADPSSPKGGKSMSILSKTHAPAPSSRSSSTLGDDRLSGSPGGGESRETLAPIDAPEKRKSKKNPLQEAEELFDLLSRAQSSRADDQRGLLRKEDLVLPDFLRLNSDPPACSTPTSNKPGHAVTTSTPPDSSASNGHPPCPTGHAPPPLAAPLSPILHHAGLRGVAEEEGLGDLTLVGEGDITSPNSTLLPLPPCPPDPLDGSLPVANFTPPPPYVPRHERPGTNKGVTACTPPAYQQRAPCLNSAPQRASPSAENPEMSRSFEGYVAELRQCQSRMQNGKTHTAHPTPPNSSHREEEESGVRTYQATFV